MAIAMGGRPALGLDITGYSAAVNDRFTGGFPTNPTPNTSGSFVGTAYDWSGVAWSTTPYAAASYKGLVLLSPQHFLTAQHYENGNLLTQGLSIRTRSGVVTSQANTGVANLGYGLVVTNGGVTAPDLAMGTLAAPIAAPTQVARYGVLDLYSSSSSTTYSVYNNLPLLAYGRGATTNDSPRVAATSANLAAAFNSDPTQTAIRTLYTGSSSVQFVEGDSAGPLLNGWTNPNGGSELTVLGVNSASDFTTYNYMSFAAVPGAMANVNSVMNANGYALRVVGNPSATWVGASSTSIGARQAWGIGPPGTAPSDAYVLFNGTTASNRSVAVDSNRTLRGMYFRSTGSGTLGFTLSGASTLTLGRGGLTNYDTSRQTVSSTIALGDSQYWDVGPGGVTASAITTNGWLLEIAGSGTARITGAVSGTGGLALSGQRLELTGSSSYSGGTFVNAGRIVVGDGGTNGTIASAGNVSVAAGATLAFNRRDTVAFTGTVSGAGTLAQIGSGTLSLSRSGTVNAYGPAFSLRIENGTVDLVRSGSSLAGILGAGNTIQLAGGTLQLSATSGANTVLTGAAIDVLATSTLAINRQGSAANHTTAGFSTPITMRNGSTLAFDFRGAIGTGTSGAPFKGTTTSTGTVSLASNAGFSVANSAGGTAEVIFAGPVVGAFGLTKTGSGTLTLSGTNTYTGPTTVSQGTLLLANAAALSSSAVTVAAGAMLSVGPQVQATVPSLVNNGLVDLGLGRLTVSTGQTANGLVAQIMNGIVNGGTAGITSSDAATTGGAFTVGWVDEGNGSFTASYAAVGDSNLDDLVDLTDVLNTVGSGAYDTGAPTNWSQGDFNYDGMSDLTDLLALVGGGLYDQGYYNAATGPQQLMSPLMASTAVAPATIGSVAVVPEPSAWALGCGAVGWLLVATGFRARARTNAHRRTGFSLSGARDRCDGRETG